RNRPRLRSLISDSEIDRSYYRPFVPVTALVASAMIPGFTRKLFRSFREASETGRPVAQDSAIPRSNASGCNFGWVFFRKYGSLEKRIAGSITSKNRKVWTAMALSSVGERAKR